MPLVLDLALELSSLTTEQYWVKSTNTFNQHKTRGPRHPHSLSERRRSTPSIPHYHTRRQRSKSEIYTSPDLLGVLKEEEELPKSSAAKGNNPTSNYKDQVLALREMGFTDQVLVLAALEKHKGNI
eukprot:1180209-Amorphochlora_amoeboformis.AAC.1